MASNRPKQTPRPIEEWAQTEAIFASIGDGAIATDEFGKITRINKAALDVLGFRRAEVIHQWFPRVIIPFDENGQPMSLIDRPITQAFLIGKPISHKMYYQRKDGSRVPVQVTVSPIVNNNRPVGAIEVFRDITQEYEIDQMKSEFISLASHQLRTPLSAIKTYAHMLLDGYLGELTPPQRRSLRTIVGASNRMNELISTLLNVARIESGSVAVTSKPVHMKKLIEEILKELEHTAKNKEVNLELVSTRRNPTVVTDNLIAKEIITNLLTNAIKYTSEQTTVKVTITSRARRLIIGVHDQGFGIPEQVHDKIFTKFFRAPNVVKRETTGTGLGLYLVKGLAEQLGGKIWFESKENVGSSFYFSLPQAE